MMCESSKVLSAPFALSVHELLQAIEEKEADFSTIVSLVTKPLAFLGISTGTTIELPSPTVELPSYQSVSRHIPRIQHTILTHIAPTWEVMFEENGLDGILQAYFCPPSIVPTTYQGLLVVQAYSSITTVPFTDFSLQILIKLTKDFNLDRIYRAISEINSITLHRRTSLWEDAVRSLISIPSRLANQRLLDTMDPFLLPENYLQQLCRATQTLLHHKSETEHQLEWTVFLFEKMIMNGFFPSSKTHSAIVSFFEINDPSKAATSANVAWNEVLQRSTWTNQYTIICSLLASVQRPEDAYDMSVHTQTLLAEGCRRLSGILDEFASKGNLTTSLLDRALAKHAWDIFLGRVIATWLLSSKNFRIRDELFHNLLGIWTSKDHIEHSFISQQQGLSTLILLLLSQNPEAASQISSSPEFISSVGRYISLHDKSIRCCGLLVAEVFAQHSGRHLSFGGWEEEGVGQLWAKATKQLMDASLQTFPSSDAKPEVNDLKYEFPTTVNDVRDIEGDSDDSFTGYASDASSDELEPSPTELSAMANDASLRTGLKRKIFKPVYIYQLLNYLRSAPTANNQEASEKVEVAINCCEILIRRKKGYGSELAENAAELARALIRLQNAYELANFDELRQNALAALVVAVPKISAPVIVEEYFLQMYSTNQRMLMMNSLSFAVRELAYGRKGLPNHSIFPSRMLEGPKHIAYRPEVTRHDKNPDMNLSIKLESLSMVERDRDRGTVVRKKQLRVQPVRHNERGEFSLHSAAPASFSQIAAEFFIVPFINQFWSYLREDHAREFRTQFTPHSYKGSGTGMILSPLLLSHFLRTLATMIHAAQNSPAYIAVLAPESLKLSFTVGNKPNSAAELTEPENFASILSASLELALVVLTGSKELDGGRSLCLDHASLLLGVGEWAEHVIDRLDAGLRFSGEGGELEVSLIKDALGVAKQVSDISSKWKGSMVDVF